MPLALSDEQLDLLAHIAEPLPPSHHSAFLEAVAARLATYTSDAVGLGSLHRLAREVQHDFLKSGPLAVGVSRSKYGAGRPHSLRAAPAKSAR